MARWHFLDRLLGRQAKTAENNKSGKKRPAHAARLRGLEALEERVVPALGDPLRNFAEPSTGYGNAVAVSGNTLVVGAPDDGAVYVYNASTGALLHALTDPTPTSGAGDLFGSSVAVSGNFIAVGAYFDDVSAPDAGAVFVYDASSGALVRTLTQASPASFNGYGYSVALSGNLLAVGTPFDDVTSPGGAVYVYNAATGALVSTLTDPAATATDFFGWSVGVSGGLVAVGAPNTTSGVTTGAGLAYVYSAGTLSQTLVDPNAVMDGNFGYSVGISGNNVVVGAPKDDPGGTADGGTAYVYNTGGGPTPTPTQTLTKTTPVMDDQFGYAVAVSGDVVVVGALYDDTGFMDAGQAYVYSASAGTPLATLAADTPAANERFGSSVAASQAFLVGGAPNAINGLPGGVGEARLFAGANPPSLSIDSPAAVVEGNSITFIVTLANAIAYPVTVNYQTVSGSATAGSDFAPTSGTLTFNAGQTTQTITVPTTDDALDESTETFTVLLSNASNAAIATASGTGTLTDNDAAPTVSINDVTQAEGDTGTTTFSFTVSLSAASGQTVTVDYSTSGDTATAGTDFTTVPTTTLTFAPGETSKTVTVSVNGDTLNETNERFTVTLASPVNATLGDGTGVGTITNDDPVPTLSIGDAIVTEGNAGTVTATFMVTLSAASGQTVTVNYATADGTAAQPGDYASASGPLTFMPGQTSQPISVTVNGDTLDEANETFLVNLSTAVNATIADGQGVGTITDDDATPSLSINSPVAVNEGTSITFTVTLSAASGQTVTVDYATVNGSATAPGDFAPVSGTLTFAPNQTMQMVTVSTVNDTLVEPTETFTVQLSNASNASINTGTGTGTINDDDVAGTVQFSAATYSVTESGVATIFVTRAGGAASGVTVNYEASNGTATAADYQPVSGTLTFGAGETMKSFTVNTSDDLIYDPNETVLLTLSSPGGGGTLGSTSSATLTINDNETQPTLSVDDVSVTEPDTSPVSVTFTVTLSGASAQTVTVNYAFMDGSATSTGPGADYTATGGTLTFGPGVTTQTITAQINPDLVDEPDETFSVMLSGEMNATIADAQGVATILDNDPPPTLSIDDVTMAEGTGAGATTFTFNVTLSNPSAGTVTVNYTTADGTATTADNDYVPTSGTLTFTPGVLTQPVTVQVNHDTKFEPGETFFVQLGAASNATIGDGEGLGTITNDDAQPTIAIGDVTVGEAAGTATFTVTLSNATYQTVTVDYATANNTATAPSDYAATSGTLVFPEGVVSRTFTVPIVDDTLYEPGAAETFFVNLTNAVNATIMDNQAVGTITDNDAQPTLSIADASATEGSPVVFTATLTNPTTQAVVITYSTADGTATSTGLGADYTPAVAQMVTIPAGMTSATISIATIQDTTSEANETFQLNFSATNATVVDTQAVGTINDDDALPTISIDDVTLAEGTGAGTTAFTFMVTLSAPSGQMVTVNYDTADGTAMAPGDYVPVVAGLVTFMPGQTSQPVTVLVNGDTVAEPNETLFVNLTTPVNATIADSQGVGTILDDEPVVTVTASDPNAVESASPDPGQYTVTRTGPTTSALAVTYQMTGTATNGSDYVMLTGMVTIPVGQSGAVINLVPINDTQTEGPETAILTLTTGMSPQYSLGAPASATVTIADNEPEVSVTASDASGQEGASDPIAFTFTRTGSTASDLTVSYSLDGTATNGKDYAAQSGSVVIPAGQSSVTLPIGVLNDSLFEGDETVTLSLLPGPTGSLGSPSMATAVIHDNESFVPGTLPAVRANHLIAAASDLGEIQVFNAVDHVARFTIQPFLNYVGPLAVAVGDVTGDGVPDVVAAVGFGGQAPAHVKVFSGVNGAEFASFYVFDPANSYNGGLSLAVADVNGDGRADVIAAVAGNDLPHVKVVDATKLFNRTSNGTISDASLLASFYAFEVEFHGGLTVAGGDVNGDGRAEVVVGTRTARNHLRVFEGPTFTGVPRVDVVLPAWPGGFENQGINVATGDLQNDGLAEIFTAPSQAGISGATSMVQLHSGSTGAVLATFMPYSGYTGPLGIASIDSDNDGRAEVVTGAVNAEMHQGHVKRFDPTLQFEADSFFIELGANQSLLLGAR